MTRHQLTATIPHGDHDVGAEVDVTIAFEYRPGRPAVMHLRNGDPGYPADPSEVEFVSARRTGTVHAEDQAWLDELCRNWLETDEGTEQAERTALDDDADWRAGAAEMRREQ